MLSDGARIQRLFVGLIGPPVVVCVLVGLVLLSDPYTWGYGPVAMLLGPPLALLVLWFVFVPYTIVMEVLLHHGVGRAGRLAFSTVTGAGVAFGMPVDQGGGVALLVAFGAVAGLATAWVLDRIGRTSDDDRAVV